MNIEEKIQKLIKEAILKGEKENVLSLRTILGELQRFSSKEKLSDDKAIKIIQKMIESLKEIINIKKDQNKDCSKDIGELNLMETLVPKSLSVEEITKELSMISSDIRTMADHGPAMGMAMKHLKSKNLQVNGNDVLVAVENIRRDQ